MKILFITHQLPYPPNVGSRIRAFNLLKAYASKHEVTLIALQKNQDQAQYLPLLSKYCAEIHLLPIGPLPYSKSTNLDRIKRLFCRLPFLVQSHCSREMKKMIEQIDLDKFQVIHIERIFIGENIEKILLRKNRKYQVIADLDDFESKKKYREILVAKGVKAKMHKIADYFKYRRYEKYILNRIDTCLVCSSLDKATAQRKKMKCDYLIVPNGVDLKENGIHNDRENAFQILYLGAMDYEPNSDAVMYFYKKILPIVKMAIPEVTFVIAGKDSGDNIKAIHNGRDIIVKGYVDNVPAIFGESQLMVIPIRVGGGTRIKILEAMAAGKAVVSTSVGCEGIEVTPGYDIEIANTPVEFAKKCIDLLKNREKREMIGKNGRKLVENKYSWPLIATDLLSLVDNISQEMKNNI